MKRGSAVGIAEARDAPAGPIFEQLRGAGRSGGAGSAVESRRARDGAASSRGKVGEGCVRQWGRGRARTSAAARTWSASNSATAAMNALVCSMAFMTFSFRASSRALMVAALVALDRQCGSTEKAAALKPLSSWFRARNLGRCSLSRSRQQLIFGRTPKRATARPSPASTPRPPSMSAALCRAHVVAAAAPLTRRRQVASRGKVRPPPDPMCHATGIDRSGCYSIFKRPRRSPDRAPTPLRVPDPGARPRQRQAHHPLARHGPLGAA